MHIGRRCSRCDAAADRVGCGHRRFDAFGVVPLSHHVFMAVPALYGDRLGVPRGLFAGLLPCAPSSQRRSIYVLADFAAFNPEGNGGVSETASIRSAGREASCANLKRSDIALRVRSSDQPVGRHRRRVSGGIVTHQNPRTRRMRLQPFFFAELPRWFRPEELKSRRARRSHSNIREILCTE
jgi:hypothetical protein